MKYREFKKIMKKHEEIGQAIEDFKDDWRVMCEWVVVNEITFHDVATIRFVKGNKSTDDNVWINKHCIAIKDIRELKLYEVDKYNE